MKINGFCLGSSAGALLSILHTPDSALLPSHVRCDCLAFNLALRSVLPKRCKVRKVRKVPARDHCRYPSVTSLSRAISQAPWTRPFLWTGVA